MATTYRRGTTVNRGGKTHYRRGGKVTYQASSRPLEGVLEAARVPFVWMGRKTLAVTHKVGDLRGRKARLERDRALVALMSERHHLRAALAGVEDDEERMKMRRRIRELDSAWRAQNPGGSMQPLPPDPSLDILDSSAQTTKGPKMIFLRRDALEDLNWDVTKAYQEARDAGDTRVADRYADWNSQIGLLLHENDPGDDDIVIGGDIVDAAAEFGYIGI